jgi:hypothetical protein
VVIARPWWRELVGGKVGGVRWSVCVVVLWGTGEILVRWPTPDTDAMTLAGAAIPS